MMAISTPEQRGSAASWPRFHEELGLSPPLVLSGSLEGLSVDFVVGYSRTERADSHVRVLVHRAFATHILN